MAIDIESLVANRALFNEYVYTSLEDAMDLLKKRSGEPQPTLDVVIPKELLDGPKALIFRQLITSNYEIRRFISLIDSIELKPLFWEFYKDKFTSNNEWKHSLGKMCFYEGLGKNHGIKTQSVKVIDFNTYNGKTIESVQTTWGESLVDFHHKLYSERFRELKTTDFIDASGWFKENGSTASGYYSRFLQLFLTNAVLFENFMLDEKEISFTKDVFLPAFIEIYERTGLKPLIVCLEPTDIEGDSFWMCHPHEDMPYVLNKLM